METRVDDLMFLRKRMVLPEQSTKILKDWLRDHLEHPFPSKSEKQRLRQLTGMTRKQLKYWFTNARRRIVPRLKKELNDLSPKASSEPDMHVLSSSSDDLLGGDEGHDGSTRSGRSAASTGSHNVSVDSAYTSSSSGRRYHGAGGQAMAAMAAAAGGGGEGGRASLALRRGSTSVPDLSSSCSSQLAAMLVRTRSGRLTSEPQRPAIQASQPALSPCTPSLSSSTLHASPMASLPPSTLTSYGSTSVVAAAISPVAATATAMSQAVPYATAVARHHPAAGSAQAQHTLVLLPGTPTGGIPLPFTPRSPYDTAFHHAAPQPPPLPPLPPPQPMSAGPRQVLCLAPNMLHGQQSLQVSGVSMSPSWQASMPLFVQCDSSRPPQPMHTFYQSHESGMAAHVSPTAPRLVPLQNAYFVRQDQSMVPVTKPP